MSQKKQKVISKEWKNQSETPNKRKERADEKVFAT